MFIEESEVVVRLKIVCFVVLSTAIMVVSYGSIRDVEAAQLWNRSDTGASEAQQRQRVYTPPKARSNLQAREQQPTRSRVFNNPREAARGVTRSVSAYTFDQAIQRYNDEASNTRPTLGASGASSVLLWTLMEDTNMQIRPMSARSFEDRQANIKAATDGELDVRQAVATRMADVLRDDKTRTENAKRDYDQKIADYKQQRAQDKQSDGYRTGNLARNVGKGFRNISFLTDGAQGDSGDAASSGVTVENIRGVRSVTTSSSRRENDDRPTLFNSR